MARKKDTSLSASLQAFPNSTLAGILGGVIEDIVESIHGHHSSNHEFLTSVMKKLQGQASAQEIVQLVAQAARHYQEAEYLWGKLEPVRDLVAPLIEDPVVNAWIKTFSTSPVESPVANDTEADQVSS